ncbi:MAG TPA: hypothetical protein VJ965_06745, partial [Anaerolineales bacterium]|nr:hypothetical protein [Anaerolineales bacterium]
MNIPLMTQPGVDKITRKPYNVVVHMDDHIKNRWWQMEQAELRCTCEDFRRSRDCRHVSDKANEFRRWKRINLARLKGELCEGHPPGDFANAFSARIGIPLSVAEFIQLPQGEMAVQNDPGLSQRYEKGCGWGTAGSNVHYTADPTEAGVLYLLMKEGLHQVWDMEHTPFELFPKSPTLLPNLFEAS